MPENLALEFEFVTNGSLLGWVVNEESVNKFKGNLDHYLMENREFK